MVLNGLAVTGVLVLVGQMAVVSKVPKCVESAEMQGGICPSPYIYVYAHTHTHTRMRYSISAAAAEASWTS